MLSSGSTRLPRQVVTGLLNARNARTTHAPERLALRSEEPDVGKVHGLEVVLGLAHESGQREKGLALLRSYSASYGVAATTAPTTSRARSWRQPVPKLVVHYSRALASVSGLSRQAQDAWIVVAQDSARDHHDCLERCY
jgi:hypothetical protein